MNQKAMESEVLEVVRRMRTEYQAMQVLIDGLDLGQLAWDNFEKISSEIRNRANDLEQLDLQTRELKEAYQRSRPHASAEVAEETTKLAHEMETFLIKLNRLENAAQKSRQALLPQLQAGVRSVKMKAAYGQYADTL